MGATPFLADLIDTAAKQGDAGPLRTFLSAGAPIPRLLVTRAREEIGVKVLSAYGMTENLLVSAARPDDPEQKVSETDGAPVCGLELRVVDADRNRLPVGQSGRLQTRGTSTFIGYLKRPELYNVDRDGWFDTGDLARVDGDGYVTITGRGKDVIIRGGENIPVVEVENLLYRHPAVRRGRDRRHARCAAGRARLCFRRRARSCLARLRRDAGRFCRSPAWPSSYWPERLELVDGAADDRRPARSRNSCFVSGQGTSSTCRGLVRLPTAYGTVIVITRWEGGKVSEEILKSVANITRRAALAGLAATTAAMPMRLRAQEKAPLRIGVLNDQSGPFADLSGLGSVEAARLRGRGSWRPRQRRRRRGARGGSSKQAGYRHWHPSQMARCRQRPGRV